MLRQWLSRSLDKIDRPELKATLQLQGFGLLKAPLILMTSPRVVSISSNQCQVKIPLNRLTQNHWKSMYFGALCIGADVSAGLLAVYLMQEQKVQLGFVFKDLQADFQKRAEGDVVFTCTSGSEMASAIRQAAESGERVHVPTHIQASCPDLLDEPTVAEFRLTLSLKKAQ